jgi:hypothetical protein
MCPPVGVGDVVSDIRIAEEVAEAYLWSMKDFGLRSQ